MTTTTTATMRAAVQHQLGDPGLVGIETIVRPEPAPGEVLIQTRAAGLNPADTYFSSGGHFGQPIPDAALEAGVTLGWDIAGEVVALGDGVTNVSVGDHVFGLIRFPEFGRTFAEYATAPADQLARMPANVSWAAAGAVPMVALTAWQSLHDHANISSGQRILIHGASGGVGHIAVQLAKHAGAYVIATASAANSDFTRSIGADEVIDYTTTRFEDEVSDVDIVLNVFGNDIVARSWQTLKPGGTLVSTLAEPANPPEGIATARTYVTPSGEKMARIAGLMESGAIEVHVSQAFPFDQIRDAFAARNAGHAVGKLVITF